MNPVALDTLAARLKWAGYLFPTIIVGFIHVVPSKCRFCQDRSLEIYLKISKIS